MNKYISKINLKIGGKMNEKDAGWVGKCLSLATIIASVGFAIGFILIGISYVV